MRGGERGRGEEVGRGERGREWEGGREGGWEAVIYRTLPRMSMSEYNRGDNMITVLVTSHPLFSNKPHGTV